MNRLILYLALPLSLCLCASVANSLHTFEILYSLKSRPHATTVAILYSNLLSERLWNG